MKKIDWKNIDGFDERQLNIVNSCYKHGFWFALVVIFSNFLLFNYGICWADPGVSQIVSVVLVFTFFTVECCLRGGGVGKRFDNKLKFITPAASFAVAVFLAYRGLNGHFSGGAELINSEHGLTYFGGAIVIGLTFLLVSVCTLAEIICVGRADKKADKE